MMRGDGGRRKEKKKGGGEIEISRCGIIISKPRIICCKIPRKV